MCWIWAGYHFPVRILSPSQNIQWCHISDRGLYIVVRDIFSWFLSFDDIESKQYFDLLTCLTNPKVPRWHPMTSCLEFCSERVWNIMTIIHHFNGRLEAWTLFSHFHKGLYLLENEFITKMNLTLEPLFKKKKNPTWTKCMIILLLLLLN